MHISHYYTIPVRITWFIEHLSIEQISVGKELELRAVNASGDSVKRKRVETRAWGSPDSFTVLLKADLKYACFYFPPCEPLLI